MPETQERENPDGVTYLREICEQHACLDKEGRVVIDLPQPQLDALGMFLIRGVVGFFLGLQNSPLANSSRLPVASSRAVENDNNASQ